jgi:hypothetical protein
VAAQGRAGLRKFFDTRSQRLVEAGEHEIILMEDVNPFSARAFDAAIPDSGRSKIARLATNFDTLSGNFANELSGRAVRRCIVNYLDLHLVRAGILIEHAAKCHFQILQRGVVNGNHHRPKWSGG